MSTYFSNVPLRSGFGPVKGFPRLSQVPYFGLQYRRRRGYDAERGRRFAVIWAIWLHRNEVVFEGKSVSSEGIIQEVERFVGAWFAHV